MASRKVREPKNWALPFDLLKNMCGEIWVFDRKAENQHCVNDWTFHGNHKMKEKLDQFLLMHEACFFLSPFFTSG